MGKLQVKNLPNLVAQGPILQSLQISREFYKIETAHRQGRVSPKFCLEDRSLKSNVSKIILEKSHFWEYAWPFWKIKNTLKVCEFLERPTLFPKVGNFPNKIVDKIDYWQHELVILQYLLYVVM